MLDKVDNKIINLLKIDARVNNKAIAIKLNISEGTVRNRIKRLLDDEEIVLSGLIDPDKTIDKQLVMLGVNLSATKSLQKKAEEIAQLSGVVSTSITTGRYDLFVEVWVDVKYGLIDFLGNHLSKINGVISTESFVIMKSYNKWI